MKRKFEYNDSQNIANRGEAYRYRLKPDVLRETLVVNNITPLSLAAMREHQNGSHFFQNVNSVFNQLDLLDSQRALRS